MDSSDSIQPLVRRPTQERGQRRFDAILDAAAAMIVEVGMAGFTVHGVAARANTSIGSMYHFFPDGESVLRALGERHMASLGEIIQTLRAVPSPRWAGMTLAEAVSEVLDPFLSYMEAHPDLLALPHDPKLDHRKSESELDKLSSEMFERLIGARSPDVSAHDCQQRAQVMHGLIEGVATRAAGSPVGARPGLFRELKVAVTAYLGAYEP